jgi:hypothetical protein
MFLVFFKQSIFIQQLFETTTFSKKKKNLSNSPLRAFIPNVSYHHFSQILVIHTQKSPYIRYFIISHFYKTITVTLYK